MPFDSGVDLPLTGGPREEYRLVVAVDMDPVDMESECCWLCVLLNLMRLTLCVTGCKRYVLYAFS